MRIKFARKITAAILATLILSGCGAQPKDNDASDKLHSEQSSDESESTKEEDMASDMSKGPAWDIVDNMGVGWNLGNTLDAHNDNLTINDAPEVHETCWGNPETTKDLVDPLIEQGFGTIRVPVTWKHHLDDNNNIDSAWLDRVQEIVDYGYNSGIYVIVNVHHEDWNYPYYDNKDAATEKIQAVWSQIAERFKDYDEHLIFEVQNEPRKVGTDVEWTGGDDEGREVVNAVNMAAYETIRAAGGNNADRLIMLPGYAASSNTEVLESIEFPEGDNMVAASVHAYTPYDFALNIQGRSEWNHDSADIDRLMRDIDRIFISKGIPAIIGEFGALNKDNEAERVEWVTYYLNKAKETGVPCIWWDNGQFNSDGENFGIIDRKTMELPYPDLMKAITGK